MVGLTLTIILILDLWATAPINGIMNLHEAERTTTVELGSVQILRLPYAHNVITARSRPSSTGQHVAL